MAIFAGLGFHLILIRRKVHNPGKMEDNRIGYQRLIFSVQYVRG